jgi:cell division protein FtsL
MRTMGAIIVLLMLGMTLVSALGVVWTRHASRVQFIELTRLQNQRDDLNIEYGRLELEQATYAEPSRVDMDARQKLGMTAPRPQDIQLVRR